MVRKILERNRNITTINEITIENADTLLKNDRVSLN